jgi:miniconductance mechanosensitive channel
MLKSFYAVYIGQSQLLESLSELLPEEMQTEYAEAAIGLAIIFIISGLVHLFIRLWIIRLLHKLDENTESEWYAVILKHDLPQRALFIIPLIIIYNGLDFVPEIHPDITDFIIRITAATMILVGARVIDALLSSAHTLYLMRPFENQTPIKSYIQLGKVIVYVLSGFFILASLADKSPWYFLSGVGAIMAIILLLFRDTLLSLVASVQLTNNDLVRVGDWIEMPQFNADGDVIDIALNTVRVQNWDKTITVIPTHKFLEHSFRNWRGMQEAGGRRIMRSLHLDMSTIRFLTYKEIEYLRNSHLLKGYINRKMDEVNTYNREHLQNSSSTLTNGRWLTNIGTFRAYVIEYLKHHPRMNKELTMLVRQLEPSDRGLPLQIYTFTNTTVWAEYEGIQADVFDHLMAIAPEFGLNVYQQPSGSDFRLLGKGQGA